MFYTGKTLVRSFDYSDIHQNRQTFKKELVNGRVCYKEGKHTATTIVGDLYKVERSSVEPFNYVLVLGMARQHPTEISIDVNTGVEIAALNAKINPFASIKLANKIEWREFKQIAEAYISTMPTEFIKTRQELKLAKSK